MTDSDDFDKSNGSDQNFGQNSRPTPVAPDFAKSGLGNPSPSVSSKSSVTSSPIVQTLRKRHIGIPLLGLVTLAIIGFIVLSHEPTHLPNASNEPDPMAQERPAVADFSVLSVDGQTFKLSEHQGKVILVSFWATECSTCVLELPAFSELLNRYQKEGFEVLSINLDPADVAAKNAKELWERGQFKFPSYIDPAREVAKALNIETVPSGVVIDRKGRLAFNSYGANDWLAPETARLIEDLLLER